MSTTVETALVELCVEYLSVSCQAMPRLKLNRTYLPFICNATHFAFVIRGLPCIVSLVVDKLCFERKEKMETSGVNWKSEKLPAAVFLSVGQIPIC